MSKNELKKKYLEVYTEIAEISGLLDIVMAVLRDNKNKRQKTDILPVANIIFDKFENLRRNSDYFLWEMHKRKLI